MKHKLTKERIMLDAGHFKNDLANLLINETRHEKITKLMDSLTDEEYYKMLGCTEAEFERYIGDNLMEGMTSDNMGTYWNIEMKLPKVLPDTEEEIFKLHHYTNFKPVLIVE